MLVIRPDSGDPVHVCERLIQILADKFGYTTNHRGYKVLKTVRIIQGDGVNHQQIELLLDALKVNGWSTENIAFGMGAGLLQKLNRDTESFAYKICEITRQDWKWGDEYKHIPTRKTVTTDPTKASKGGDLDLIRNEKGKFQTIDRREIETPSPSALIKVFENGQITARYTFENIRKRANGYL